MVGYHGVVSFGDAMYSSRLGACMSSSPCCPNTNPRLRAKPPKRAPERASEMGNSIVGGNYQSQGLDQRHRIHKSLIALVQRIGEINYPERNGFPILATAWPFCNETSLTSVSSPNGAKAERGMVRVPPPKLRIPPAKKCQYEYRCQGAYDTVIMMRDHDEYMGQSRPILVV